MQQPNIEDRMGIALRDIGIPPRPSILVDMDREMARSEPDFTRLARILGADVALAAALIKTTNSPFFGFNKKVRTVQEALLVLGLKVVISTIAGIELRKAFQHVPDMERFWDTSAKTAQVSGWLALRFKERCGIRAEDAHTFGLFRDCGIPVLMIPFPEYRSVLGKANAEKLLSFTAVEDQLLSVNHAEMGASLAESWLLPDEIALAIRHHHDAAWLEQQGASPGAIMPSRLIAMAHLAEHLIQERTGQAQTQEWGKVAALALPLLAVDENELGTLVDECGAVVSAGAG
jgi:HD-like signal output (HDOD) protein